MTFLKNCSLFFKSKHPHFLHSLLIANKTNLQNIYHHPFNQHLFKGTLPSESFGRYLRDDYFYLNQFAFILQQLAKDTLVINADLANQLDYLAKDIIKNELNMQLRYKEHLNNMIGHKPGSIIVNYTQYLTNSTQHSELAIALTAFLPCFWIYYQLGRMYNSAQHLNDNPYKQWIAAYSSPDFISATQQLANTINTLGEEAPPLLQSKMSSTFQKAVIFELNFFDSIYDEQVKTKSFVPK